MSEPLEGMRARVLSVGADGGRSIADASDFLPEPDGWVWLDVTDPSMDDAQTLAHHFGLDRQTREDLVEPQSPKFDELDQYRVIVAHALAVDSATIRTIEVDVIVGERWLVTTHPEPVASIDHLFERAVRPAFAADDPFHLACRLLELVGERYLPILDELDTQIFDLEDDAIDGNPAALTDIHAIRRDIAVLRRTLAPQRRALESLSRQVDIDERARRDLSDALDHHVRFTESLEAAHQMVVGLLDTYRGATAEQMNEVMKVLTVFSAIFMPLTLIAGIYGMNFEAMPEIDEPWGYRAALAAMVVLGAGLWLYFVRRGFIGGPRLRDLVAPARAAGRVGRGLAAAAALPIRAATRAVTTSEQPPRADD